MTKAAAIAALENYRHLKGKFVTKKDSSDTSRYEIKAVAVLPFGQKITDLQQALNPNNFSGHDWDVYIIMEPHSGFFAKVAVEDLDKKYHVLK